MWPFYNESFSVIISGRIFELLMKFFLLNDAEKQPNHTSHDYDKIYKIRPLSIIGYKGRLSWIQYMPKKHKMGYQSIGVSWCKNDYVYNFKLYTNKLLHTFQWTILLMLLGKEKGERACSPSSHGTSITSL